MDDAQPVATVVAAKPFQPGATRMVGFRRRSWFFRVLLGETAGFVVPGLAWFAVWKAGLPPPGAAAIVALSGAAEGAALGIAQWLALREWHAGFSRTWILASAAGASVAWACGMIPSTAHDLGSPTWLSIALGVSLAPVLLLSLPGAQWLVLRRYVPKAWKWVIWSTAGWLLALPRRSSVRQSSRPMHRAFRSPPPGRSPDGHGGHRRGLHRLRNEQDPAIHGR
ncbi:MAG: hypothetical protein IPF51_09540 [Dehalococcoidia bacterium]|uniref:hypothetical protein n=1 Tax=Candidatus Amarobacter glycogenicus TaxID=3140699 RepID=UPI00313469CC|nr:hypothetical protein [Dehalococcoidia bacterium]